MKEQHSSYTEEQLAAAGIPERLRRYRPETQREANERLAGLFAGIAHEGLITYQTALDAYMSLCEKWTCPHEQYEDRIDKYGFPVD